MASLNYLKKRKQYVEKKILHLEKLISQTPEGRLISRRLSDGRYYYTKKLYLPDGSVKEIYMDKNNLETARILADKQLAESRLKDLKQEKNLLERTISFMQKESAEIRFRNNHPGISRLTSLGQHNSDEEILNWKNAPYNRNKKYPENLKYSTIIPGLIVRSKAEADIAACLERNGVPYHYDEIFSINGNELAIDFLCMNPRTRELWYWDHRGMADDSNYIRKILYCDSLFYQAGIIPWINLIITTETRECPLDLQWVDTLIQYFLL